MKLMYKCDICGAQTKALQGMILHRKRMHPDAPKIELESLRIGPKEVYKCNVCGFEAKTPSGLALHKLKHAPARPRRKMAAVTIVCGRDKIKITGDRRSISMLVNNKPVLEWREEFEKFIARDWLISQIQSYLGERIKSWLGG